ncbi:hypothetical protein B0T26DRAFT_273758 [Lasiosphaeria miniovina]|uniref:Uncharacterized protein n=1 Tax=Lasiosphaeria miniovina TaxID=1954250 RepID=A0AA40AJF6_9PEZI|nr:uncharacterized protein B0T26DRAFT_273758 [Lasiosphaeria miniovina]KAK0717001.1 hypothetical protein B0T26DRAFT_273758 [Lasiosphaeria miniovina]
MDRSLLSMMRPHLPRSLLIRPPVPRTSIQRYSRISSQNQNRSTITNIAARLDSHDTGIIRTETRIASIETKLVKLNDKVRMLNNKVGLLNDKLSDIYKIVAQFKNEMSPWNLF